MQPRPPLPSCRVLDLISSPSIPNHYAAHLGPPKSPSDIPRLQSLSSGLGERLGSRRPLNPCSDPDIPPCNQSVTFGLHSHPRGSHAPRGASHSGFFFSPGGSADTHRKGIGCTPPPDTGQKNIQRHFQNPLTPTLGGGGRTPA